MRILFLSFAIIGKGINLTARDFAIFDENCAVIKIWPESMKLRSMKFGNPASPTVNYFLIVELFISF